MAECQFVADIGPLQNWKPGCAVPISCEQQVVHRNSLVPEVQYAAISKVEHHLELHFINVDPNQLTFEDWPNASGDVFPNVDSRLSKDGHRAVGSNQPIDVLPVQRSRKLERV